MTKEKVAHTPTPWHISKENGLEIWPEDQSMAIPVEKLGGTLGEKLANAAFIVRAINSHEELVQNLKSEHEFLITKAGYRHEMNVCTVCKALAKAEGKE